jgi:hypothetical protein
MGLTGLVFILVTATQGVHAARDACDHRRDALKRHSVEPLISQRTSSKYSDCAGDILSSGLGVLFGDDKFDSSCAKNLAEQSVDEAAGNFVDNEIKKHKNRREVQDMLDDNAHKQVVTAHSISGSIDRLRDCRNAQVEKIQSDYKRERISLRKRNDGLEDVKDQVKKDNQIIAELIGETGENLKVLEASNDTLADIETSDDNGGESSVDSGKAIGDAARSQKELETQQEDYADLLAQIEKEKDYVNEDT